MIKVCGDVYLIVEVVFLGFPVTCLAGAVYFREQGRKAEVEIACSPRTLYKKLTGSCYASKFPDDLPSDEGADNNWCRPY